ncbi:MAG TPA: GNAT family N-acetyltransferase [Gemmatimonadaceae bacterium]|nr:GNAT family N-acetyltransferase [Gemmatimonadaceae bacterium]
MSDGASLRPATLDDVSLIAQLIQELAEYEKLAHTCVADDASVRENLFGEKPAAEVVLAFIGEEPAGFALFFENYSTHLSRRGMHLEDLYVREHLRGKGIGRMLLSHLAAIAVEREYGRMEWAVLRWNESAIRVYDAIGAEPLSGWLTYRLSGEGLERVAGREAARR